MAETEQTYQSVQRQLTDFIRDPESQAGPSGVEPRRLNIYRDLFFNNIEGFLSSGFPVLRSLYEDEPWYELVRDFMRKHQCRTPYFLEIAEEFLAYLQHERQPDPTDPPFMLELAHYEWVELALDVASDEKTDDGINAQGDLLVGKPVVSPLAWPLAYRFPVHHIGEQYQPREMPEQPSYIVVYRTPTDEVEFMEINAITHRLLALLQLEEIASGEQALVCLAEEIQHPQPEQLRGFGAELLEQLHEANILLGTRS